MNPNFLVVLCTCPDEETAKRIALKLVESKKAACVNLIPGLSSIYYYEGELQNTNEVLLMIKTTTEHYDALEGLLTELHPYTCPEIIGLPIHHGHQGYLQWLQKNVLA